MSVTFEDIVHGTLADMGLSEWLSNKLRVPVSRRTALAAGVTFAAESALGGVEAQEAYRVIETAQQLKALFAQKPLVLDTRPRDHEQFDAQGKPFKLVCKGCAEISAPFDIEFNGFLSEADEEAVRSKNKMPIFVYCREGVRSDHAARYLVGTLGFPRRNVFMLKEGVGDGSRIPTDLKTMIPN